ncbi:MAG: SCP2 sterol-binding domain-containing protein [Cellvibrio sp.]
MSEIRKLTSIEEVISSMTGRFQSAASKNIKATYQWKISGDRGKTFCVSVNSGTFAIVDGVVENPSVTFETDCETYLRLVNNELKAMTAILTRKLQVRGNIYLAGKMDQIFK